MVVPRYTSSIKQSCMAVWLAVCVHAGIKCDGFWQLHSEALPVLVSGKLILVIKLNNKNTKKTLLSVVRRKPLSELKDSVVTCYQDQGKCSY